MVPGNDDADRQAAPSTPTRSDASDASRRSPSSPELETLTFHPRPDADGLVARLGTGVLVPPHPADAARVTPGEAWACTLAEGPGGDTVARLVARVEPAPRGTPDASDPASRREPASRRGGRRAGDEAPSPTPTDAEAADAGARDDPGPGSPRAAPGPGELHPDEEEQLERRRQELIQREEMLEAQLEEVRERILDLEDVLGG